MESQTIACLQPAPVKQTMNSTILLIEDDQLQVDFLEMGLKRQGFRVLSAMSCNGGFRLARSERPDAILLDVLLPDGCGLALCQQLADNPETANIPIIILSGSDESDIVRQSRFAGCHYFLKKPYDPNTLLLLINKTLERDATESDVGLI
ncbi:MAG TPA: response regulator [Pirellulaceae bacterium]|nr:response regulator [Pirellulaceae bacterium]HMO90712.1 response regulator [Pirellulaceae bacterium]HMP71082.1 response regulator [Pirellulaceae bacterium]